MVFKNNEVKIVYVINVDEVPAFLSRPINERALCLKHPNDERTHNRRNNSPPILGWPVHIEIAQDGDINAIELAVAFAKRRAAMLTGSIDAYRSDLFFPSGKLIDTLVLSRSVRVDKLSHFRPSRGLQNV